MSAGLTAATWAAISAGIAAVGALSAGVSAKRQAKFQTTVQRQQAERTKQISAQEEKDFRRQQSMLLAQRRAALGGAGIETATGTALLAPEDFAAETELQALRIRSGGETQATRLEQQAQLTTAAGKAAMQRGVFRAGSSLLTGFKESARFGEKQTATK